MKQLISAVPLLAVVIVLSGCTSSRSTTSTDRSPQDSTLEDKYWERQEDARTRFVDADVDFMTGMISHHAQALVMAAFAPDNGASQAIRTLCARIINAQNDEIATMQGWLRDRGQPVPQVHIEGSTLMVHGAAEHHMHMPGMLSDEQMAELEAAMGPAFDRLFLRYMIQHHKGALTMVDNLFATDGAGQDEAAFKMASDIHADQITEIARMEQMLAALEATN